jgi:hypothetical protein
LESITAELLHRETLDAASFQRLLDLAEEQVA